MKPVERFFRKYFLSMVGIIALFLLLNVVLFFTVLIWAWHISDGPEISIYAVRDSVIVDAAGNVAPADGLNEQLKENRSWAMLLDDTGTVIWEECLPEEVPRQYTPTDVAKFSRWYLRDYPVFVLEHPAGLLVVGTEKNSYVKYCSTYKEPYIRINPYLHMVPKSDRVKALLKRSEKSATEWEITEADTMGWRGKADANTGVFENAL